MKYLKTFNSRDISTYKNLDISYIFNVFEEFIEDPEYDCKFKVSYKTVPGARLFPLEHFDKNQITQGIIKMVEDSVRLKSEVSIMFIMESEFVINIGDHYDFCKSFPLAYKAIDSVKDQIKNIEETILPRLKSDYPNLTFKFNRK